MKKVILCIFGLLFFSLACFMGCNISAGLEEERTSAVAFAPTVTRGFVIDDYHWKYFCSLYPPDLSDTDGLSWEDFNTKGGKGLGVIKNLTRDGVYYVGLRAYDSDLKLKWEGYYLKDDDFQAVPKGISVSNKTQLVKIDEFLKEKKEI